MKIVYASGTPLAGVSELMARSVNQYFAGKHEAWCLSKGPGKHKWYCRPGIQFKRLDVRNKDHVRKACEWGDVIHCNANVSARSMGVLDLLKKKTWVYIWHGGQIWPFERVWIPEDYPHVKFLHIGQGWVERQQDFFRPFFERFGAKVVPNIISSDDPIHTPLPWKARKPGLVAFSPSNQKPGAVNQKGIPQVKAASKKSGYKVDVILSAPFEECMKRKRLAQLGIDEVVTPMYHRSGLEFLAQGVPCICSYNSFTERILKEATGSNVMPFMQANPRNLDRVISAFMSLSLDEKMEMSRDARAWIDEYYNPKKLLERYIEVYVS